MFPEDRQIYITSRKAFYTRQYSLQIVTVLKECQLKHSNTVSSYPTNDGVEKTIIEAKPTIIKQMI